MEKSVGFSEGPDKDAALQAQTERDFDASPFPAYDPHADGTIYGRGNRLPMRRLAIWRGQHGKWRCIEDGHFSGHNDAVSNAERVHIAGSAWTAAVARHFRVMAHLSPTWGHPPVLTGGNDNEKSAFCWEGRSP